MTTGTRFTWSVAAALLLPLGLGACAESTPPAIPVRDCRAVVFYRPAAGEQPSEVAVVGAFNWWDKNASPLYDDNGDGLWLGWVEAPPGPQLYRIWNGRETRLDAFNPLTFADWNERESSYLDFPDCSEPALVLESFDASPQGAVTARLRFDAVALDAPLDPASVQATLDEVAVELDATATGFVSLDLVGVALGKHQLRLSVADVDGRSASLALPFWVEAEPFDWRDAIIYQVMVDRFRRGDAALDEDTSIAFYHGGDLWGVVQAIEDGYFQSLGANAIWLSPVYENPEGRFIGRDGREAEPYHGYWAKEPRQVESRFGGEAAMDALVRTAHAHGLRVVLDFVLNHVHEQHPYWTEHRADGWFANPDADCICGMSCPWHLHMNDCWFDPFLPDFDWANPDVAEQLLADAEWWVERFDLDGLRLDAVPMMPRYTMRHLRERIRERFELAGTHVYLLGETYTQAGEQAVIRYYLGPTALSGQFDFPVMWTLRSALAGRANFDALDAEVARSDVNWSEAEAVMAPILGNHDVPRFVSDMNGDPLWEPRTNPPPQPTAERPYRLLGVAWTFLLTQIGAPVIYYGDEIGLAGAYDPDNRRNMRFDELSPVQSSLREHVGRVAATRQCVRALRRGERTTLLVGASVYAYARHSDDGFPAVVALNRSDSEQAVSVQLPAEWLGADARFADVLGSAVEQRGTTLSFTVPARGSVLAVSEERCW